MLAINGFIGNALVVAYYGIFNTYGFLGFVKPGAVQVIVIPE